MRQDHLEPISNSSTMQAAAIPMAVNPVRGNMKTAIDLMPQLLGLSPTRAPNPGLQIACTNDQELTDDPGAIAMAASPPGVSLGIRQWALVSRLLCCRLRHSSHPDE